MVEQSQLENRLGNSTSADVAIRVEHVSKKFSRNLKKSMVYGLKDISRNILGMRAKSDVLRKEEFWAVDDISFEVKKGETLGLIGPNGSGKSTILKMLNGIYWPDKGRITIRGKVGALIEIGAGFHPMLTGRENIYVNSAILGMTKREVDNKFDSIVDFADIGDFIDMTVKFYSSGMLVRLGFAVAVHCEVDILLVDEVLAVGDMVFQRKCVNKMQQKTKDGTTIVFVTHSMNSLLSIVEKTALLKNGGIRFLGSSRKAVNIYTEETNKSAAYGHLQTATRRGSGEARIIKACIVDEGGNETKVLPAGSPIRIKCRYKLNRPVAEPTFFFTIKDGISSETVLRCSSIGIFQTNLLKKDGEFEFVFEKPELGPRQYYLHGGIITKGQYDAPVDIWDDAGERFVIKNKDQTEVDEFSIMEPPINVSPYNFKIFFDK